MTQMGVIEKYHISTTPSKFNRLPSSYFPEGSEHPWLKKVIIIGGTAAGLSAASKAKRVDPSLDITVFEKSGYISYGACGLPYFVGDMIKEPNDLVSLSVDQMTHKRGVPTFIHHEVTRIDRGARPSPSAIWTTARSSSAQDDKLVIATGARPIVPAFRARTQRAFTPCAPWRTASASRASVQSGARKKAAIIGGGFIGIEVAEELTNSGVEVHLFEMMSRLLPFLTESFSEAVLDTLTQHGVHVHLNAGAQALMTAEGSVCGVARRTAAKRRLITRAAEHRRRSRQRSGARRGA